MTPLDTLEYFLQSTLRISTPLLFAALGELLAERAGLINIGLEGKVLSGAFAGFAAVVLTGSLGMGVCAAIMAGLFLAILFGFFCITLRNDQIVTGAALNFLALGLTGLLYKALLGETGSVTTITPFGEWNPLGLERIPVIGPLLFSQGLLTYLALFLMLLCAWLNRKTRLGFHLTAVGEHPRAADAAGIPVNRIRWMAILLEGVLGGLAGASLTLSLSNTFNEAMSNGRGFIAIAIVIFGRWHPLGILAATLFFGAATALQFLLQASETPWLKTHYPYLQMMPYLLTLLLLATTVSQSVAPAGLGKHYHRE
jgi:simple sugar transport system permease protein